MDKIRELRAKIEENLARLRAFLDTADEEKRDLTDEETQQYEATEQETDKLKRDLVRLEKLAAEEEDMQAREDTPHLPNWKRANKPPQEFRSFGEFICAVRFNPGDPRLQDCEYVETRGAGDQSMGVGTEGGFMVPEQFRPELLQVQPQEGIFRPRSLVIPAGDPPDAKVTMPSLDQTTSENVYGGIVVEWVAEGGTKNITDIRFKEYSMEPHEVAGYTVVTDKLLRNWQAASAFIGGQFRKAIIGAEDYAFLRGNGVGKPLGLLNQPSKVNVTRTTANSIATGDILNMYARIKMGGSFVWIGSQTIIPELYAIQGGASENLFIMNAAPPAPGTLLGIPIMWNDRAPALGSEGDLILADLSYYMIKDGSGPFVDASPHVYFTQNKTVIKAFWNVDGNSWLTAPLPLEGSTSNTVSPFVVLK